MRERKEKAKRDWTTRPTATLAVTDGALLLLTALAALNCILTAYGIEVEKGRVTFAVWAFALAALGLMSLPRWKLPLSLAVFAGWGVYAWKNWELLSWGEASIRCAVVNTMARKVPGIGSIRPLAELTAREWVGVNTTFLMVCGVLYILLLAFLICRLRRPLWPILLTILPLLPAFIVTEAPAPVPMAALMTAWTVLLLTGLTDQADPAESAWTRPRALVAGGLLVVALFWFLPTQGTAQPGWAADLRGTFLQSSGRLDLSTLAHRIFWSFYQDQGSSEYIELTTPNREEGKTALRVRANAPGTYLLRGWSADVYTGTAWEPLDANAQRRLEAIRMVREEPLLLLGRTTETYLRRLAEEEILSGHSLKGTTVTVENVSAPGSCVYVPYGMISPPGGASLEDASHVSRERGTWYHTTTYYPEWRSALYIDAALPEDAAALAEEQKTYRDFVYETDLQLSNDLKQTMLDWWDEHTGDLFELGFIEAAPFHTPEEYAQYNKWYEEMLEYFLYAGDFDVESLPVKDWRDVDMTPEEVEEQRRVYIQTMALYACQTLQSFGTYDLEAPLPSDGEDYVQFFLEHEKGWCMQYATTGALLLRSLGIPARYVSGYVAYSNRASTCDVPDSDAHAWVEYYLDGVGWVPLDVTPAAYMGSHGVGGGTAAPRPTWDPDAWGGTAADPEPEETEELDWDTPIRPGVQPGEAVPTVTVEEEKHLSPWYLLCPVVLAALALLGRGWMLRRREGLLAQESPNAAVLYAYGLYDRLGSWGGGTSEEFTALAKKAKFSQHTLTDEERTWALEQLDSELARLRVSLTGWKKALFRLIWK